MLILPFKSALFATTDQIQHDEDAEYDDDDDYEAPDKEGVAAYCVFVFRFYVLVYGNLSTYLQNSTDKAFALIVGNDI